MPDRSISGPSDYLAAERTFLAWIRTGLALMGFGFVVARFGLFLQALNLGPSNLHVQAYGPSFWFGTALIALGVVVDIVSAWNHFRLVRELNQGTLSYQRPSWLAMGVAGILAVVGLAMAIYVISVRDPGPAHLETPKEKSMSSNPENGIVTLPSPHSVEDTVAKIERAFEAKGVKLFALIDHSGEAEKVGLQMRPTKLLIFGSPKAGTPVMIAAPTIAIDLPLKILVWEDHQAKVWISYNTPAYLQARHGVPAGLAQNIAAVEVFARAAAQ